MQLDAERFVAFGHTRTVSSGEHGRRYSMFAYTFAARPPFELLEASPELLLTPPLQPAGVGVGVTLLPPAARRGQMDYAHHANFRGEVVQFPMSLEIDAGSPRMDGAPRRLWLGWGQDDKATMLSQLDVDELKALLRSVQPQDVAAECTDEPLHLAHRATCRGCLVDHRGGSCQACERLGFDCACVCPGAHSSSLCSDPPLHPTLQGQPVRFKNGSEFYSARYFSVFDCEEATSPGPTSAGPTCLIWKSDTHLERWVGGARSTDGLHFGSLAHPVLVLPADWARARMTHNVAVLRHSGEFLLVGGRDSPDVRRALGDSGKGREDGVWMASGRSWCFSTDCEHV